MLSKFLLSSSFLIFTSSVFANERNEKIHNEDTANWALQLNLEDKSDFDFIDEHTLKSLPDVMIRKLETDEMEDLEDFNYFQQAAQDL